MITLKRLEAKNFKSLHSVTLLFPEHGAVLIEGHNEAGKSTLFEAVYVALYGKPLVGEDKLARQEEVIQYGQSHTMVQLTLSVGQQEMTISRHFEKGKSQQAKLVIQRPGTPPEEISRVRAVDERILKELGNLDGDSLRNSCFVEQKELGRIEALSLDQRKQAIQKLLGLERLTQLIEQFKFRREQERELILAQGLLRLAKLQAEVRTTSAEEAEFAERLDAVKVAIQVNRLAELGKQKEEFQRVLAECMTRVQEARGRLERCSTLKEYVSQSDKIDHQITAIAHTRSELLRIAGELERLDTIEQVELPQARAYLKDVRVAAEAVTQVVQARRRVQAAEEAYREAERSLKALEQAEADRQQKEDDFTRAQERVVQRREEAEVEQRTFVEKLSQLEAQRGRLVDILALVKQWEAANRSLQDTRLQISTVEEKERALLKLESEIGQQEETIRNLENAVTLAEREMQQANEAVRLAAANEALTNWIRLKGVEMALEGYVSQHAELSTRHQEAEKSLVAARTKTRMPMIAGVILTALAVLTLVVGFLWHPAFILTIISLAGAIFAWIGYSRVQRGVQQHAEALAHWKQELQQPDMQRQAAIQVGGDPVTLHQYENQILASGLALPTSLEVGRSLQERLQQQLSTIQGHNTLQETAQMARDSHIRLAEQLKQARSAVDAKRQELSLAQRAGNPAEQLAQLKVQVAAQEQIVEVDESIARQSLAGVAQWPVDSNSLQTWLSGRETEIRTTGETQKRQELVSVKLVQEAKDDRQKAEYVLQQARALVATKKADDPASQLSRTQEMLTKWETICQQLEEAATPLLNKIQLHDESEVEPERGRAEAKIQASENVLKTRPQQQEQYKACKVNLTNSLTATSTQVAHLLAALHGLNIIGLSSLPQLLNHDDISYRYEDELTATLNEIRKVLQAALLRLDEQGTRKMLDDALGDKARTEHQKGSVENAINSSQQAIDGIFAKRGIVHSSIYTYDSIVTCWSLIARVFPDEESQVAENLEQVRRSLYAARQQESQLAAELHHPNTPLSIAECLQKVTELVEEREVSVWATQLLRETHDRIARRVLPITERNMQPLLHQLTGGRYRDVRLTPEDKDGQQEEIDYRIRVWDPAAGRYVAKNLFSGGTRDQCSLALRLAFALATLPQELGVAPGFIFLDEPLSAFDSQRAQALVELITSGTIAQQFHKVILISHQHAFDREAFQYHVRMDSGRIIESDLSDSGTSDIDMGVLQFANAVSD